MSVELTPSELGFRRPFSQEVTESLRLSNPHGETVAFKVKTTAPKQYCVRPNSGLIPPNGSVEVQVLLQAMKEDPPPDTKCRDKFLVQSVLLQSRDVSNVAAVWADIEKTAKASIQERKIRVTFLPAGSGAATNGVSNSTQPSDEPPSYSSPAPQFGSPATNPPTDKKSDAPSVTDTQDGQSVFSGASTAVASAAGAVSRTLPTSQEELKQQLADAKAQIKKLSGQAGDPQLRQRKVQEASQKVQTAVQQTGETGVPVQIVAGLCLLSFLLAYFFF